MDYSQQKQFALLEAAQLGPNQTRNTTCPACGGRGKFSVTRLQHSVVWNCFKLECPVKGGEPTSAALTPAPLKQTKLKPYTKPLLPLGHRDWKYFSDRFGLDHKLVETQVALSDDDRYVFTINNMLGYCAGYVVREPVWSGIECPRKGTGQGPKAVTYMHADVPIQSWYTSLATRRLILVEDMLSAMKIKQHGQSAVALLGTQLDARKARQLSQWRPDEVIIALDEDATEQAFKLARKWGLAFPKVRVAILEQDIKDTDNDDVLEVLGL